MAIIYFQEKWEILIVKSFKRIYVPLSSVEGENVADKQRKTKQQHQKISLRKNSRSSNKCSKKSL